MSDGYNVDSDPAHEYDETYDTMGQSSEGRNDPRRESEDDAQDADLEPEEGDADEEDEDEEEQEDSHQSRKQSKQRHKRSAVKSFLDIEAEDSEDDDEGDEDDVDDEQLVFIDPLEDDEDDISRQAHARLDAMKYGAEDRSAEEIANEVTQRHLSRRTTVRYTGDMNEIPQRLLMPSVHDPSLWQVRVKPGRERDLVLSLMRKAIDVEFTSKPLQIFSAFQRDSLPGMIYVEARSAQLVTQACSGLVGIYPSRGVQLVPIDEMASLLQIKKHDSTLKQGSWVRIRRGKYAGDLAQVLDVGEAAGDEIGLKLIPRIDLTPRDESALDGGRKRKNAAAGPNAMRPPQRLFNYDEVIKIYGRQSAAKRNGAVVFNQDTYRDGFMEKDFKLTALITEDVNPTLDEIARFSQTPDGTDENAIDLSIIAESSKQAAISVLQPGDHVEVFEGEQAGVQGIVEEINQNVVTITATGVEMDGQKVDLPARSVRKRFKAGDHVKVMAGKNQDETGLVVSVVDNVVTFLSDMSMQEVSVFSKDLREAAEVGSSTNIVGNYELHELVQLDLQTVGVIFKTERDSFKVVDQHGQVRTVLPHQISMRRESGYSTATDCEGHPIRAGDNMKETEGEGRKGRVLHVYQAFFAFLHNREITDHGGVFVAHTRTLTSITPKGMKLPNDLTKMDPTRAAPTGGMVGSGAMGRGPRDRDIGTKVIVKGGSHKGYIGTIKDTNGLIARVELSSGNKLISIEKDKLEERIPRPDGGFDSRPLGSFGSHRGKNGGQGPNGTANRTSNPYANAGSRTPFGASRTPNPYAENARTPAWNASSRTPNPYANGAATPAWNASSRTPNPYADGNRTPAWNANSRTPNPYTSAGGATPARPTLGGATPSRINAWDNGDGWTSPRQSGWGSSGTDSAWSAPTPAGSAETPAAAFNGAPTPMSAPTPFNAPTPGAFSSATPGFGGPSAPTPREGGGNWTSSSSGYEGYRVPADWLYDSLIQPYQARLRVVIARTRMDDYLDGAYEGKLARVTAAQKSAATFEQVAMIQFEGGEQRSFLAKYLDPLQQFTKEAEALVLTGKHKGHVVKIWEVPNKVMLTYSTLDMTAWEEAPQDQLCLLAPDAL